MKQVRNQVKFNTFTFDNNNHIIVMSDENNHDSKNHNSHENQL